ncbi:hypothetical protein BR10RB9215_C10414 [Brucella sp. 10RB9215]|uniref:DUF6163 family protein n=1 Tax=unclassified Brucella TaxID=2632610 RepID=UPI0001E446E3|nr:MULTISPECIES: DUF6163 family protein [unclassified Brucella]APY13124.1 hypothetical protein BKD02_01340 [Brucella sp. 09RB8910]EFM59338.1 Hypothetical protein BIBO2_1776 [Brucella sp. BO2]MRN45832.1 hypothetical protein [Brucella sp. 10RB9212]MRN49968.1 hypothetical protein [Brucella sp. 10RB9214]QGA55578.1 hypothetical protein GHC20_00160 [Brucella sp. 2280]
MHMNELRQHIQPSGTEWAFTWFMRLLALAALASGVFYWIRLIGIHPGLLWRFDLMPGLWQTAVVALAVLMPVASTGLWMRAPWGPVLWFVAAIGEIAIYSVFARHFEYRPITVAFDVLCILVYIVFRVLLFLEKRRQARASLPL